MFQMMYPFAHNHTFIFISPPGLIPSTSAAMGNLLNPAYVTTAANNYRHPYSFVDRVSNIIFSIIEPLVGSKTINIPCQIEVRAPLS